MRPSEAAQMDEASQQLTQTKPFRLVKYFSFTSFFAVLAFTAILSTVILQRTKAVFLEKSEESARILAANLNHQVFYQFVIPTAMSHGQVQLRNPDQFQLLDRVVRATIHSFKVDEVMIYSPDGIITYSTRPQAVGQAAHPGRELDTALSGQAASKLISREGEGWPFAWLGLASPTASKLKTLIPFRAETPLSAELGPVLGVFEITQDLTADYKRFTKYQYQILAIAVVLTALLFFVLRAIVMRAEVIIERQSEERRRLEEQLNHSERLASLGEMVAAVSHEVRNPLGIICSTAELLKKKLPAQGEGAGSGGRLAEVIMEEANRLNGIVTEFLDFARPQKPRLISCRVADIMDRNLELIRPELEKHDIRLVTSFEDSVEINADPGLLYRAFLNVLVNAVQAMPEGGRLSVATAIADGGESVRVSVADSGAGIPEDILRKVWNPFFTTKDKGSGLGLPIVRNIIEAHRGRIEVDSTQGKGTRVLMTLPVRPA